MTGYMNLMDFFWEKGHRMYEEEKIKLENSKLKRKDLLILAAQAITRGNLLEEQLHFLLAERANYDLDKIRDLQAKEVITGAMFTALQNDTSKAVSEVNRMSAKKRSDIAKNAADILHKERKKKHKEIREIWMTGIHPSRDKCAEDECEKLGMSFDAARKALRNTPKPQPSRC